MDLTVLVTGTTGLLCLLTLERSCNVQGLKQAIGEEGGESGIPVEDQRLFVGTEPLNDDQALVSELFPDSDVVEVRLIQASSERDEWLLRVQDHQAEVLADAPEEFRGDRELVLAAVNHDYRAFQFASEELKADSEIALAAVRHIYAVEELLHCIAPSLFEDREFVLQLVKEKPMAALALSFVSDELRADKEIALAAIKTNRRAFDFIDVELQGDEEIIEAVLWDYH